MPSLRLLPLVALLGLLPGTCFADPCGMVPPVYVGDAVPIARIGVQQTYVFHRDGLETFVIRPAFRGKVEEFGMLIPMPAVPALRKVADNVFPHIAAAIDPPEVVVSLVERASIRLVDTIASADYESPTLELERDEVVVEKEEAVGMYEVAVLRAGSAAALNRWMADHGYKYPKGMDAACEDYVRERWCFVAVKTKVGAKANVDPKPGMRGTNPDLPVGSSFDGHVQALGFRFPSRELVVPMRLSTFNEGDLRNVVYVLSDSPLRITSIPSEYVVRQIPGVELLKNVTQPLPLRIIGGTAKDLQRWQKRNLPAQRDPGPVNGAAKELFAGDLLAVKKRRLVLPHEETEKMLLRIGERLELRGSETDSLHAAVLETERAATVDEGLELLARMTLTVVDGDFPRAVLASENLRFQRYTMPARRNSSALYDAKTFGPAEVPPDSVRFEGTLSALEPSHDPIAATTPAATPKSRPGSRTPWRTPATLLLLSSFAIACVRRRRASTGR